MKTLEKIGFMLFLLAGGLVLAGDYFGLTWLFRIALIAVGLIAWIGGIRSIRTREVSGGRYGVTYRERYTGTSAWLIGVMLLVAGAIIIGLSLMDLFNPGGASAFLVELADSPYGIALILALTGVMVTVFGITRILSGSAKLNGTFAPHVELAFRVGGVVSILIGLVLLLLAVGLILAPGLLRDLFDQVVGLAKGLIADQ